MSIMRWLFTGIVFVLTLGLLSYTTVITLRDDVQTGSKLIVKANPGYNIVVSSDMPINVEAASSKPFRIDRVDHSQVSIESKKTGSFYDDYIRLTDQWTVNPGVYRIAGDTYATLETRSLSGNMSVTLIEDARSKVFQIVVIWVLGGCFLAFAFSLLFVGKTNYVPSRIKTNKYP